VERWISRWRQYRFSAIAPAAPRSSSIWFELPESTPRQGKWIDADQRRQFEEQGYLVIRGVVPEMITASAVIEIATFVDADLNDSSTWYQGAPQLDGIVPLHHAQALWDIRQWPRLYQAFTEFYRNPRLMVDINRCIFRPPVDRRFPQRSFGTIHWDTDPRGPQPASIQGVVLLSDIGPETGGFQCIPEIFQNLDAWLARYARSSHFNFFRPGLNHWRATQVVGKAGDVILWSSRLPHGSATNHSNRPRIAAFVSMGIPPDDERLRESMKLWWLTKRAPDYWRGLPGQLDPEPGPPALLSQLGLKLIGAIPW
jgi:hypothetical protein